MFEGIRKSWRSMFESLDKTFESMEESFKGLDEDFKTVPEGTEKVTVVEEKLPNGGHRVTTTTVRHIKVTHTMEKK